MSDKQYLPKENGRIKKEFEKFKTQKRIEVGERLRRAKELGISENSEYLRRGKNRRRLKRAFLNWKK